MEGKYSSPSTFEVAFSAWNFGALGPLRRVNIYQNVGKVTVAIFREDEFGGRSQAYGSEGPIARRSKHSANQYRSLPLVVNTAAHILTLQSPRESRFIRLFLFQSVKTEIHTKHLSDLRGENAEL